MKTSNILPQVNILFGAKAIPFFAATGSVGVTVAAPHISTFVREISSSEELFDSNVESRVFIAPASASIIPESLSETEKTEVTKKETQEKKLSDIEAIFQRIKKWMDANGGCRVNLVISASSKTYFQMTSDDLANNSSNDIFTTYSKISMSKFEKFANDLEGRSVDNYSQYLEGLKTRCTSNGTLFFQWRDKVEGNILADRTKDSYMVDLQNLWVDESLLSGIKVSAQQSK